MGMFPSPRSPISSRYVLCDDEIDRCESRRGKPPRLGEPFPRFTFSFHGSKSPRPRLLSFSFAFSLLASLLCALRVVPPIDAGGPPFEGLLGMLPSSIISDPPRPGGREIDASGDPGSSGFTGLPACADIPGIPEG
eukprot:30294-Pelagococcus_subviridis.AAC.99